MSHRVVDLTGSSPQASGSDSRSAQIDALLQSAIQSAQPDRLRVTLQTLCKQVPDAASVTAALLLITRKSYKGRTEHDKDSDSEDEESESELDTDTSEADETEYESGVNDEEEDNEGTAVRNPPKAVRSRYAICRNCREEFDVAENESEACVYHSEDMVSDGEVFADWDEDCHGPMDTPENRVAYPENFLYQCCNQDGTMDGCETGKHVEEGVTTKKARHC